MANHVRAPDYISQKQMIKTERLPILAFAMLCLLAGLWSGLNRIGWNIALLPIAPHHGSIMVGGFLGTLIALEKIIPLNKKILFLIPVSNGMSVVLFFVGHPIISLYLLSASSIALCFVFLIYFRTQRTIIYVLMLAGSVCWLIGNILLLTKSFYPLAFPWWAAFVLFIIAAERLELMKFLPVKQFDKIVLILLLGVFVTGVVLSFHGIGSLISGVSIAAISLWFLRHDIIPINIKKSGMPRFIAISLFCGYVALLLTGVFFFSLSDQWHSYDAIVHTFFLGFVFSMIFAHGPMILPGIMGMSSVPFHKALYLWLVLLQTSWILRVGSDIVVEMETRRISGLLTTVSILGYFSTMAILTIRSHRHAQV